MRIRIKHYIALFVCLATALTTSFCFAKSEDAQKYQFPYGGLSQEQKVQKLLDINEISNVMSKHAYYHQRGQHAKEWETIWVKKTPNPVWGQNQGYWVGYKAIYNSYVKYHDKMWADTLAQVSEKLGVANVPANYGIGELIMHTLTTQIIEVAGDGKTAKGVWYTPGQVTQLGGDGTPSASWIWERYGVDFIKEDGQWKIWHLHIYTDFMCGATESWAKDSGSAPVGSSTSSNTDDATVPTISETTFNTYSKTQVPQVLPKLPEPYWTFSETFSYGPSGY